MKYELLLSHITVEFEADSAELYIEDEEFLKLDITKAASTITFTLEPGVELYELDEGKPNFITSDRKIEEDMNDPVYGHINDDQIDELRLEWTDLD